MSQSIAEDKKSISKHVSVKERFAKPKYYPLYAFALTTITFILSLLYLNILGFGNNTILRSDLFGQYIDFIQMFLRVLKGEESFWYSFSSYLGSGTALTYAYYTINPFNLLYLIDGISVPAMTAVIITIKLGLCAYFFSIFSQKVLKKLTPDVILFSMCYALGSYAVTMHYNIMWLDAIFLVPLITWLIIRFIDTSKFIGLTLAFFYLFITNFYMGYMVGIFSAIVFILVLLYRYPLNNRENIKHCFRLGFRFANSALLAIGLCAFLLVPAALFLYSNMAGDNFAFTQLQPTLFDLVNSMFIGEMQTLDTQVPLLYCGIPVLLLLPYYFICNNISKREKIFVSIAIAFYIICMLYLPLYEMMHAFDYPNMYGYRFVYILVFIFVAMATRVSAYLKDINKKKFYIYAAVLIIFYSFMIQMQSVGLIGVLYTNSQNGLLINAGFIFLWLVLFTLHQNSKLKKEVIMLLTSLLLIFELSVNGYLCISKVEHYCFSESSYNQWQQTEASAINEIQSSDSSFYRIHVNKEENHNAAAFFGFNSLTTFSSSDNYPLRQALSSLGIGTSNRYISEVGYTPITNMLFAAKYSVTLTPDDKITNGEIVPAQIETNPYSLSLGYMVDADLSNYESGEDPFLNQEYLLSMMCGKVYKLYEGIPIDTISVIRENEDYAYYAGSLNFYHLSDFYDGGQISFSVPHRDNEIFYLCFPQATPAVISESPRIFSKEYGINEVPLMSYGAIAEGIPYDLYDYPADSVFLYFSSDGYRDYASLNIYANYYNGENLPTAYEDLASGNWNITDFKDDCITGTVTATEDRPIFFTSIPYDKDWHAYVDGEEVQTYSIVDNAFLSLLLSPGEHTVTLQYIPSGSDIGLIITSASIILLLISILFQYKNNSKIKASEQE